MEGLVAQGSMLHSMSLCSFSELFKQLKFYFLVSSLLFYSFKYDKVL
jgi:hypothetical protein